MKLFNIKNIQEEINLDEALLKGSAENGGLYLPNSLPEVSRYLIRQLKGKSFEENAFIIARKIFAGILSDSELRKMINAAFPFDVPLKQIDENIFALELFHGPTMAFKDIGAGFMAQLLQHFVHKQKKDVHILVATSGDTGGAVAHAFKNATGIKVSIFYPAGKVSRLQEQQLNVAASNIFSYRVKGTFDDCQRMVKSILREKRNDKNCFFTTANSINIGRLLPQMFYYFHAVSQLPSPTGNVVCSVPSGNFGNLCAGLLAKKMGLSINSFVATTNANDTIPRFFETNKWRPKKTVTTLSNAMDISVPNNFDRILHLYNNELKHLKKDVSALAVNEEQTKESLRNLYNNFNYLACPHSAVAAHALMQKISKTANPLTGIFLCTASPLKFKEIYPEILPGKNLFREDQNNESESEITAREIEPDFDSDKSGSFFHCVKFM